MNHVWLAYDALIVVLGAGVMALLLAVRDRRPFLGAFALFYAAFTASLLVALSRGYVTLNVAGSPALPVFLAYGLGTALGCVALFFALRLGLRALEVASPWPLRAAGAGLALATGLMLSPPGVRFDPATASYALGAGYFLAGAIHLAACVAVAGLMLAAARRVAGRGGDRYDAGFFAGMCAFAAIGSVESALGLVSAWQSPVGRLDAQGEEFLYSSIPYLLLGLFLCVYLMRLLRMPAAARGDMQGGGTGPRAAPALGLSQREQEVLDLVLDGLNNKRIATQLDISVATVKTHLSNIFRKAEVGSRFELARRIERGAR